MSHVDVLHFPRGFLLSERPVEPPPTFVSGPLLDNFFVHPWTKLETASDRDLFVIVIGDCVSTEGERGEGPAAVLLSALKTGEGAFLHSLGDYGGRHTIIFGEQGNVGVVNDATGMRSVFYAAAGGVIASHALLVERALGGKVAKSDLVFAYGYPGNRTPYPRTRILTPNTYYWLTSNLVRRFWPIHAPAERTVESVAAEVLEMASNALRNINCSHPVKMALTAGLDSRVILAVGLHAGVDFGTYTYGTNRATSLDRNFAPDLAAHVGVPHTLVGKGDAHKGLRARLHEANYSPHHIGAVPGLMGYFEEPNTVAMTGNLLEIGRSFYKKYRDEGVEAPVNAASMVELHRRSMTPKTQKAINEYGIKPYFEASQSAFEGFISDTGYDVAANLLDPFDQFYWEHRMGVWHGPALLERDFYGVAFIPFNSRRIFEAMLGVAQTHRDTSAVFYRMIELVDPSLLELPVNPPRWSAQVSSRTQGTAH